MDLKDKERLRALAAQQLELSQSPKMQECVKDWAALGRFQSRRPMVQLELATFEEEMIPQRMQCQDPQAREMELQFLRTMLPHLIYEDDKVVPEYFPVYWDTWFHLFDQVVDRQHSKDAEGREVGHRFVHPIQDLEQDQHLLQPSTFGVNRKKTSAYRDLCQDTFGDILPVRMSMGGLYAVPTQKVVHLMGMENMMYAMYDYPELFKQMMDQIAQDYLAYFNWLEKEKLLLPTTSDQPLAQGTYCFTDELPQSIPQDHFTTRDVWGYLDSQESVSISPAMFEEFIFPCYEKIAARFGLLSYGCCEPVHPVWQSCLSRLDNLRRVSISPWCDEEYMGQQLKGRSIVYYRKPSPNYLGVDVVLDEEGLRQHITKTLRSARGCTLEITQRDVYTIHHNEAKAKRYVEIIRECIQNEW